MPLLTIVTHTPPWVWGLFAALLALGLLQTRARRVSRAQLVALPLSLLVLSLWSLVPAFAAAPVTLPPWLAALAVGALAGRRMQPPAGAAWDPSAARLQLPGCWLPLALIVAIFLLRYGMTVALLLHPAWRTEPQVLLPMAMLYGTLSGALLGRAAGLLALTAPAAPALRPAVQHTTASA